MKNNDLKSERKPISYLSRPFVNMQKTCQNPKNADNEKIKPCDHHKKKSSAISTRTMEKLAMAKESVGLIKCGNIFGTCFLLSDIRGKKTVMTCKHVIDDIEKERKKSANQDKLSTISVHFDDDYPERQSAECSAEVDEEAGNFSCENLDYAIMFLKDSSTISHLPLLGCQIEPSIPSKGLVTLIGYPGNNCKSVEICHVVPEYNWRRLILVPVFQNFMSRWVTTTRDSYRFHFGRNDVLQKKRLSYIFYHTSFTPGSSGSPVFNKDGHIVGMHSLSYLFNIMQAGPTLGAICQDVREKYGNETYNSLFSNT